MPRRKRTCRFCKERGHNIIQCSDHRIPDIIHRLETELEPMQTEAELLQHLSTYTDDEIAVLSCRHNRQPSTIPRDEQVDSLALIYSRRQTSGRIQAHNYMCRIQRTYPFESLPMAVYLYFKAKIDVWINHDSRDETFVYLVVNMNCQMLFDKVPARFTDDIKWAWDTARIYANNQFKRLSENRPIRWGIVTVLKSIHDDVDEEDQDAGNSATKTEITCPICLTDHETDMNIVTTNCKHSYCVNCMETYLDNNLSSEYPGCPMCRGKINLLTVGFIDHLELYREKYSPE